MKFSLTLMILYFAFTKCVYAQPSSEVMSFLEKNGCVWAADRPAFPFSPAVNRSELKDFSNTALANNQAVKQGEYLVFDQTICEIKIPDIKSSISLDDPDIQALITEPGYYEPSFYEGMSEEEIEIEEKESQYCYIFRDSFVDALELRGYSERDAWVEADIFYAEQILMGNIHFYQTNKFRTPISFQVTYGEICENAENIDELRKNRAFFTDQFDAVVRDQAVKNICGETSRPFSDYLSENKPYINLEAPNYAAFIEYLMVFSGSGFISLTDNGGELEGIQNPPLCHY